MQTKISVLINTLNEEKNIRNCLESVKWADEIIIVDMYSDDKTVEIAKEFTDKIYFFEKCGYADPARQFAVDIANSEWVLIIDADELVSYKMYNRIKDIIENNLADIVYFPRNNYFFGKLLIGSGWGALQDFQPRLFKKAFVKMTGKVHDIFDISHDARKYYIKNHEEGFIHFNYIDVEHFLEKSNRYTTIEAKNMFEGIKSEMTFTKLLKKIFKDFIKRLFIQKGYKDEKYGFSLSILMTSYYISSYLKFNLMKKYNSLNPKYKIIEEYKKKAEEILNEYKNHE